jgi:hypothetical protein
MAAATYRVGPSDLFLPSDLAADATTLDGQVQSLDALIEGNEEAPPSFVEQWVAFQGQWAAFYANDFGGTVTNLLTALNDSNRDQLISYENQFQTFATSAAGFGAQLTNNVQPSTGSGDSLKNLLPNLGLPSLTTVAVIVVAIVLILVVWKV